MAISFLKVCLEFTSEVILVQIFLYEKFLITNSTYFLEVWIFKLYFFWVTFCNMSLSRNLSIISKVPSSLTYYPYHIIIFIHYPSIVCRICRDIPFSLQTWVICVIFFFTVQSSLSVFILPILPKEKLPISQIFSIAFPCFISLFSICLITSYLLLDSTYFYYFYLCVCITFIVIVYLH